MKGYFGIGVENLKSRCNLGTLWRHANNMGASFIFVIGNRYRHQSSDTVKAFKHIPLFQFKRFEDMRIPHDCLTIGIEIDDEAEDLMSFYHPERAVYVLGAEDHGICESTKAKCQKMVKLNTKYCLNVATMGSIVMYDRMQKSRSLTV